MNFRSFTIATLAALLASISTSACVAKSQQQTIEFVEGQAVSVTPYESLAVRGAGTVSIERADNFSVTIVNGAEKTKIVRKGSQLVIRCWKRNCRRAGRREVIIQAPTLEGLTVIGDIEMVIGEGFEAREALDMTIVGNGRIEAWNLPARTVDISIVGGGLVMVTVSEELDVSIVGGGEVNYVGEPKVSRSIVGSGRIEPRP